MNSSIDWKSVEEEPFRPNTTEELIEIVRFLDDPEWEMVFRWVESSGKKDRSRCIVFDGDVQYCLRRKEKKLREWTDVVSIETIRGENYYRGQDLDVIEFPEGWNPPSPPGSKVLTKAQVELLRRFVDMAHVSDATYKKALEILK